VKALALSLICLLGAGCGDSADAGHHGSSKGVIVRGTVRRADDGRPVEGAEITGPEGRHVRSGPGGKFALRGIPQGTSGEVRAEFEGGWSAAVQLRALEVDEMEIVLHLTQD